MDLEPSSLVPLEGGASGLTFLAEAAGERCVVRIHPPGSPRGTSAPEVDAAVLRLVRGLVPVPEVLEVRLGDDDADRPGLLVTSWCEGTRGDLALAAFDDARRARMGEAMGHVAATLAGMATLRAGTFVDPDLVPRPFELGLEEWVDQHAPGLVGWSTAQVGALGSVARRAEDLLASVGRTCVVHSDLNPKNVLVSPEGAVLAVVDWEYAHSGHPATDLGNVVRLDRDPAWEDAAVGAWVAHRGGDRADVLEQARAAELWALVELAARERRDPAVERADALLRAVVETGDLHARPAGW